MLLLQQSKLEEKQKKVHVTTSVNVYKNGMYVGIPGTNERGNGFAAALGAICRMPPARGIGPCRVESVGIAREMIDKGLVSVICDQDLSEYHIEATVLIINHSVLCRITGSHTNVVSLEIDGKGPFK